MSNNSYEQSFEGGLPGVTRAWQKRRRPLVYAEGEELPPLNCDLDAMEKAVVRPGNRDAAPGSSFQRRFAGISDDFEGASELALLNAVLIINLRKRAWPEHAPALFLRLWREKSGPLIAELSRRWLISSIITFADHGDSEADRHVGQSLNLLFSLMKLFEAERLYSGLDPRTPFGTENRAKAALPMGMPPFALLDGDLDVNLIAPLQAAANRAPVAGPLASHLLRLLNLDDATIFRRISLMRRDALIEDPSISPTVEPDESAVNTATLAADGMPQDRSD